MKPHISFRRVNGELVMRTKPMGKGFNYMTASALFFQRVVQNWPTYRIAP